MRDIKYKVYSVRLEDENIIWLKEQISNYNSPNLFFRELRKKYDKRNKKINK